MAMKTVPMLLPILSLLIMSTGCTHTQLGRNTVRQSGTLSEIYQQQVLNNLAKFACDPHSLPDFSYPAEGISFVNDSGSLSFLSEWDWKGTGKNNLGGNGERQMRESWTLVPIRDPRRLELMRCAYQRAVSCCNSSDCPNCAQRFNEFYTGDPTGSVGPRTDGIVDANCIGSRWFHVGCKKEVPKDCPCQLVGEHCGNYVWVDPGRGTDELTKLTLAVLDFAVNPAKTPAPKASKKIVAEYARDEKGQIRLEKWTQEYTVPADKEPLRQVPANAVPGGFESAPEDREPDFLPPEGEYLPAPWEGTGRPIIINPGAGLQQSIQRLDAGGIDLQ